MAIEDDPEWRTIKKDSHKKFIMHYMSGKNATDSYALAFPKANRLTAQQHGHKLKKKYAELIGRQHFIPSVALERVASQTLENLTLMAFADIGDCLDKDGKPKALKDIPKPLRLAITELEIDGDRVKYKFSGKPKALELLAKISKIDNPQPQVEINMMISEEERQARIAKILQVAANRNGEDEG